MKASLTEVINLGNKVQKFYYVEPADINSLMLEYDLDQRIVDISDVETEDYLETIDISLYDIDIPDADLDKKVLMAFLNPNFLKIYLETDDYSDIL